MFSDRYDLYSHAARIIYFLSYVVLSSAFLEHINCSTDGDDAEWKEKFASCGLIYQSPISIDESTVTEVTCPDFYFEGFNESDDHSVIQNIWYTFSITPNKKKVFLSGGPLKGIYILSHLDYRFNLIKDGNTIKVGRGSDHAINNTREEMEQHMYMYKSSYYDVDDASGFYDGVLVLAVFYEARGSYRHPTLTTIGECMPKLNSYMETCTFDGKLDYGSLLPESKRDYFVYRGSLTVPPCLGKVTWVLFKEHFVIDESQIRKFFEMDSCEVKNHTANTIHKEYYRRLNIIDHRTVFYHSEICSTP